MYTKYEKLKENIASLGSVIIAFSGGVDSSFLLKVAHDVLGSKAVGIMIATPYIGAWEIADAQKIAKEIGVQHEIMALPMLESIQNNPQNRCYLCKHALFTNLLAVAKQKGMCYVAEGSNVDDSLEHRPGRVALEELAIKTPLLEVGMSKAEIRELSKKLGLSTWDKPSYACLLTRFPHDKPLSFDAMEKVAMAEAWMIKNGYGCIRVRFFEGLVRLEMSRKDKLRLLQDSAYDAIVGYLKQLGFLHVTLDLEMER